jgi:photosystem II stability/assembly factor-like uncharacterized protein
MIMRLKACLGAVIFCTLWVLSDCQPGHSWHWERAEAGLPHQVVILALATDPADPNQIWAGYYAPDGLATSYDGGQTWNPGAQGLHDNPVFDLLLSPGNVIWAATRDGLMKSTDRGASWHPAAVGRMPTAAAFALEADASGRIYVGLDDAGLFIGEPDKGTWKPLANDETLSTAAVLSTAVSADGKYLYAGTAGHGLFASQDAGRSWSVSFPGDYVPNLVLSPFDPTTAVASLRDRLARTTDGGQSWETLDLPWARDEVVSLIWLADAANGSSSPVKANGALLAGSGQAQIYCSQDGGESWREMGSHIPTQGAVLAMAAQGDRLLAGTWTGIYARSTAPTGGSRTGSGPCNNDNETWTYLSPSLGIPNANTLLAAEAGLLIGTRAGLFRWEPSARLWVRLPLRYSPGQDAPPGGMTALKDAPSARQIVYAGTAGGGLFRSDDGGGTWLHVPSGQEIGIRGLVISPEDINHIFMLAAWERIYESGDGGHSWQARWTGLGVTSEAISLAIDAVDSSTVYLGTDAGLYRSHYGGQDWRPVGHRLDGQTVLALVSRPTLDSRDGPSILYIGATRGAYRSYDAGDTVEAWGHGLEEVSVTAILFDPDEARTVYAGTAYDGVYQSFDGGERWQRISPPEMETEVVEAMAWGPAGELFVASAAGVWVGSQK